MIRSSRGQDAPNGLNRSINRRYGYLPAVADHAWRFLLRREATESTRENLAVTSLVQFFQKRGLPRRFRAHRSERRRCATEPQWLKGRTKSANDG